jgi:pyruvate ferredoxin oxidoreductase gamma subunit
MSAEKLKTKNAAGFFEIRLESIGGFGANLAGKLIAEAAILGQDLNGSAFAAYGSEKKGTPVKSYIRLADPTTEIRVSAPVEEPHIVAVFNETLVGDQPVMAGLVPGGTVVVNTTKTPDQARDFLKVPSGRVICLDAERIAVMMGAVVKAAGFLDLGALREAIRKNFEKKYPKLVASNIKAFERGYNETVEKTFPADGKYEREPYARAARKIGFRNAPFGGVLPAPGSSRLKDLSASREGYVPVHNREKCTDCGRCDTACPDMCFVWREGTDKKGRPAMVHKGIDYRYCKGCLRCVEVCPSKALTRALERDVDVKKLRVPLFEK